MLESRASGKTLRFRAGEVEGTGGHGALGEDPVTVLPRLFVQLRNNNGLQSLQMCPSEGMHAVVSI